MTEFDSRWQECAARARQTGSAPAQAPAGLATRAWAQFTAVTAPAVASAWPSLSWRALVLATVVLVVCLAAEFYSASSASAFAPHLEDLVTRIWEIP